jgi:uncharacterized protein
MEHHMAGFMYLIVASLVAFTAPGALAGDKKVDAGRTAVAGHRIIIQINEDDSRKWHTVLANIRNIQAELGAQDVAIAVVAIGPGLGLLNIDSLAANNVQDALATGVEFIACGNTMKAQQVADDDLVSGVRVVTAGYVELVRRQQQGWAYLRP